MIRTPSGDRDAKTVRGSTSTGILVKHRGHKMRKNMWYGSFFVQVAEIYFTYNLFNIFKSTEYRVGGTKKGVQ